MTSSMPSKSVVMWLMASMGILAFVYIYQSDRQISIDLYKEQLSLQKLQESSEKLLDENTEYCKQQLCPIWMRNKIIECQLKKLEQSKTFWNDLTPIIDECSKILQKTLQIENVYNYDDVKYIVKPVNYDKLGGNGTECFSLTIGIGNDIEAEKKLKIMFPRCKFTGLDPIYESGKVFTEIGHFWNIAVGKLGVTGTLEASVLSGGVYKMENVSSIPLDQILNKLNVDFIDFLLLDAEGAEYNIIPALKRSVLGQREICQISAEIHGFSSGYHMTEPQFKTMFIDFLKNSDFVPIIGSNPAGFNRMFWMNFGSPKCIEKYLSNYC